MITVDEARSIIATHVSPVDAVSIELNEAAGCILREDVRADAAYPSADRSTMDGYAIIAGDPAERFRVVTEVKAGEVPDIALSFGECGRVFTGAFLPRNATQVIKQEDAAREGQWMTPGRRDGPAFVRRRGEEAGEGDIVVPKGAILGAPELAILAQVGVVRPKVSRRVNVTHLATGDEVVPPEIVPTGGKIRDTNSSLIRALVRCAGGEVTHHARVGDDPIAIVDEARQGPCDLLLVSGGASVGDYDFGARALRELGYTIHFERVNLRPGAPLIFGALGRGCAFVIPGNPVSHFVCFQVAIRLALELFRATRPRWEFVNLPLDQTKAMARFDGRETFWPTVIQIHEGRMTGQLCSWSSSGDTFSLAGVNALARFGSGAAVVDRAPMLLLER